jgi:hypothetical protein
MELIDAQAEEAEEAAQRPEPSLTPFDPNRSLITLVELSQESWLVAGIVPGVERQTPA